MTTSLVEWVPCSTQDAMKLIDRAVVGGYDIDQSNLWIIRARFQSEINIGKFNTNHQLAFIATNNDSGHAERNMNTFEVCCIDPNLKSRIVWTRCRDGDVPKNAVEGARRDNGEILYIGRARQDDEVHEDIHSLCPGTIQPKRGALYVTYNFHVYAHSSYEVMCIE